MSAPDGRAVTHRAARVVVGFAAALIGLAGCVVDETGVDPPHDQLYYPLAIAPDPDGRYVYVNNAVFDRRYNASTVVVLDTFTRRVLPERTVRVGLFAGELAVSRLLPETDCLAPGAAVAPDQCAPRTVAYTVTRDDSRLIRIHAGSESPEAAPALECNQGSGRRCRGPSVFSRLDAGRSFPTNPFSVAVDGRGLFVTHASAGVLSYWLTPNAAEVQAECAGVSGPEGETCRRDAYRQPRFGCAINLPLGANGVALHPALGWAYVSDRFSNVIHAVEVASNAVRDAEGLVRDGACTLVIRATLSVDVLEDRGRSRGLGFSADGTMLYVASSSDASVRVFDTSVGPDGMPRNRLMAAIPVGEGPTQVRVAGLRPGESRAPDGLDRGAVGARVDRGGEGLVYVTVLGEAQVAVIDPYLLAPIARIKVDRSPTDIAFVPDPDGRLRAFVTHFDAHTITILDIEPGSPSRFETLATLR